MGRILKGVSSLTTTDPLSNFKADLAQRFGTFATHGVPEKVMQEGMVNLADVFVNFASPRTPEEALAKEMWELADDDEKRILSELFFRVAKKFATEGAGSAAQH